MNAELWTVKWLGCGDAFKDELAASQRIIESAKSKACPNRRITPEIGGKP
jgi:hypothetical protein